MPTSTGVNRSRKQDTRYFRDERTLRFGVWAPVHGPRAAHHDPAEPYDASWERNRTVVLEAEALGYRSTLIAQHTVNPHREDLDQFEAWTATAALAAITARIEIMTAIEPYLFHPVVLAKMALQIENISHGRFALNLVNAWNKPEPEKAGIDFASHDDRYAYAREWISLVSQLISGERVNHRGEVFDVRDYMPRPADLYRERPLIDVGGESEPARDLVAAHDDVWFINGQPLADVASLIADVAARHAGTVPCASACPPSSSPARPTRRPSARTTTFSRWRRRIYRCARSSRITPTRRSS